MVEEPKKLPSLIGEYDDEELTRMVIENAVYFTVVQITPGQFRKGGRNYDRHVVPTLEDARTLAKTLYEQNKKNIIIYAVADFIGAKGFSRPIETYPPQMKSQRELDKEAKRRKKTQRQKTQTTKDRGFQDVGLGKKSEKKTSKALVYDSDDTVNPMVQIKII